MRIVVAMSGGVDSSVVAGLLAEAGPRGHRRDAAALRPRRGDRAQGRLLRRARTSHDARDVADRLGIPHYVIDAEARFRAGGDRRFRRQLRRGRDAGAVRALQPERQVHRPARRWRATWAPRRWRPGITSAGSRGRTAPNCTGRAIRSATRAGSCSRPRASSSRSAAFRSATCRTRRRCAPRPRGSACRSPTSRTARTSASCPSGSYADLVARLRPDAAEPGEIVDADGQVLGQPPRRRALHGRPGQGSRPGQRRRGRAAGGAGGGRAAAADRGRAARCRAAP